jgi:transcriptional regulator with XRE-family HTH domain
MYTVSVQDPNMESSSEAVPELPLETLGRALRRARVAAGISVRGMAGRLGLSPSHVSQVERGVTSPSVHTLFAMVRELGLSLDDLLVAATSDAPIPAATELGPWPGRIVRAGDRRRIKLPGGVKWELLIPAVEEGFEFVEYLYEVGGGDGEDFFRRKGWEYGLVLEGRLKGEVGFAEIVLEAGDSITFDSGAPHRFWNGGDVPARAVWVWHNLGGDSSSSANALHQRVGSGIDEAEDADIASGLR